MKKQVQRSSAYPVVSLPDAIKTLSKLQGALGDGPYSREAATEALGYSSSSGTSARLVAALVQYGFLARKGSTYKVSSLGKKILHPTSEEEENEARKEAAVSPSLFKMISEKYRGTSLPGLLENILTREYGINKSVAPKVSKNLRVTLEFAGILSNGVISEHEERQERPGQPDHSEPDPRSSLYDSRVMPDDDTVRSSLVIDLPSGIAVSFPRELSYYFATGEFGSHIKEIERKAKSLMESDSLPGKP